MVRLWWLTVKSCRPLRAKQEKARPNISPGGCSSEGFNKKLEPAYVDLPIIFTQFNRNLVEWPIERVEASIVPTMHLLSRWSESSQLIIISLEECVLGRFARLQHEEARIRRLPIDQKIFWQTSTHVRTDVCCCLEYVLRSGTETLDSLTSTMYAKVSHITAKTRSGSAFGLTDY